MFARFIAFARFVVERNLIVIESTVSIFAQRESILRAELFMCGFILSTKTLNTLQKRTGNVECNVSLKCHKNLVDYEPLFNSFTCDRAAFNV